MINYSNFYRLLILFIDFVTGGLQSKNVQGQNMSRPPVPGNFPNNPMSVGYNSSLNGHGTPPPMNKSPMQRMPPPMGSPANRFPSPMVNVSAPPQTFMNGPVNRPLDSNSSQASGMPPHSLSASGNFSGGISSSPVPGVPRSSSANALNNFNISQTNSHSNSPVPPNFSAQPPGSIAEQRSASQQRIDTPPTGEFSLFSCQMILFFSLFFHVHIKSMAIFFFSLIFVKGCTCMMWSSLK